MRKIALFILILGIFSFIPVSGYPKNYEFRGSLREWIKVFSQTPNELDLLESRVKLEFLSGIGKKMAFRVKGYLSFDGVKKQARGDLKEAYIDYYSDILDIRLGKQIITWGTADGINPTDILNPLDLSNIIEDKSISKIGLFALKMDFKFYDYILETLWVPEFDYLRLPTSNSRWTFFDLLDLKELPKPSLPMNKFKNTEFALKVSRFGSFFDFSISYFNGWDNIFTPQLLYDNQGDKLKIEKLLFHRTQLFAADFATSLRTIGFWGEGGYFLTEDVNGKEDFIKNPYFQYVVGADYTFDWEIKVNIQYFQEVITKIDDDAEREKEEKLISKLGISFPLQKAIILNIEKEFGEERLHRMIISATSDLKEKGFFLIPSVSFSPEDAVNIEVGALFFEGEDNSIFGRFRENDQIYIKWTYSF